MSSLDPRINSLFEKVHNLEEDMKAVKSLLQKLLSEGGKIAKTQKVQLQSTKSIVDVPPVMKPVTINDASVLGKILTVAKKGMLNNWRKLAEVTKAVIEEGWTISPQQVNNGLNDLVKQQLIAKKHTDRNYYKLAKNVLFKKEDS